MLKIALLSAAILLPFLAWEQSPCDSPLHWGKCAQEAQRVQADQQAQSAGSGHEHSDASNPNAATEAQGKSDYDAEKAGEEASEFWSFSGRRLKITDSLLALFTFLLVVIGSWQGYHLKRTVDSGIRSERAFLYLGGVTQSLRPTGAHAMYYSSWDKTGPLDKTTPLPFVEFNIGNIGRSAAIVRSVRSELFLGTISRSGRNSPTRLGQQPPKL